MDVNKFQFGQLWANSGEMLVAFCAPANPSDTCPASVGQALL